MNWTIKQAIAHFENLVGKAFSTRSLLKPISWIFGNQAAHLLGHLNCNFLFSSESINSALKEAFTDSLKLFGNVEGIAPTGCKVAVVAIGDADQRPFLLSNYNREWRTDDDDSELMLFRGHYIGCTNSVR